MANEVTAKRGFLRGSEIKEGSFPVLACFFVSHGIFHFMSQSFSVMLPAVKNTFGINPIQIGLIITVKEVAAGLASLPGGVMLDSLRRHRALLMALCMVVFGIGWLCIGLSSYYELLLVSMVILSIANAIWHLPSLAELGALFSHNRGAALAVHGAGGSVGDIFGPVLTGLLLNAISWQHVISMYAVAPVVTALWVFWAVIRLDNPKNHGAGSPSGDRIDLKSQWLATKDILRRTHIWRVNVVAGLRGMCFAVLVTFLPLFMKEDFGFSDRSIGFHFGLLWVIGIVASPMMGHLSDSWGRKRVLVPTLWYSSVLIILLSLAGKGMMFTVLIALLGVSIRSDYSLVSATVLDLAGSQVATTMLAILSFTRFLMGALAPVIAGALYQYAGMQPTLFFVAALFAGSAIVFSSVDMTRTA